MLLLCQVTAANCGVVAVVIVVNARGPDPSGEGMRKSLNTRRARKRLKDRSASLRDFPSPCLRSR